MRREVKADHSTTHTNGRSPDVPKLQELINSEFSDARISLTAIRASFAARNQFATPDPRLAGNCNALSRRGNVGTPLLPCFGLVVNPAISLFHPRVQRNAWRPAEFRLD